MPLQLRLHGALVNLKNRSPGEAGRSRWRSARHALIIDTQVAIVEDCKRHRRAARIDNGRKMFRIKPLTRIPARQGKVSLLSQPPQHVAAASAMVVVDSDDPALMPHGEH